MFKSLKTLILVIILLVGVALIVLPFAFDMFDRTTAADEMMEAFRPIVNNEHYQALAADAAILKAVSDEAKALVGKLGGELRISEGRIRSILNLLAPELVASVDRFDKMVTRLAEDTNTIGEQVDNFAAAEKLPVKAIPYIMIALGAVIVVLVLLVLGMWRPAKKEKQVESSESTTPSG